MTQPLRNNSYFSLAEVESFYEKEKETQIDNVTIESIRFGNSDHGILDLWIYLKGDGWGQGYGGYALDDVSQTFKEEREPIKECAAILQSLTHLFDLFNCEGTLLRVYRKDYGKIFAIGHITKDIWFSFEMIFDLFRGNKSIAHPKLDDLLYPQFAHKFEKTISIKDWQWLQKKAQYNLLKEELEEGFACKEVQQHWQSICNGQLPFGFQLGEE